MCYVYMYRNIGRMKCGGQLIYIFFSFAHRILILYRQCNHWILLIIGIYYKFIAVFLYGASRSAIGKFLWLEGNHYKYYFTILVLFYV